MSHTFHTSTSLSWTLFGDDVAVGLLALALMVLMALVLHLFLLPSAAAVPKQNKTFCAAVLCFGAKFEIIGLATLRYYCMFQEQNRRWEIGV